MRKAIGMVMWLLFALLALPGRAAPLTACAEPSGGPPWLYLEKDTQGKSTGELAGFTADMVRMAFGRIGREIKLRGDMPLSRCLEMVAAHQIDFAFGAYYDGERAKRFVYSKPYKVLTPQIFYSAARPIEVHSIRDLARYHGCGMHGWTYAHYGLKVSDLDSGAHSYVALVAKLKLGRCDYFPEELEVLATQVLGKDSFLNDPQLLHVAVPDANPPSKHLVAAQGSEAALLIPQLNAAMAAMIKNGDFKTLWRKHAGDLPF